jgi:GNAT superfamily N-acetyltransferase
MDKRALYRARTKLESLFHIVFGDTYLFRTYFFFEKQTSKVHVKKVNEVEIRPFQPNDLPKLKKFIGPRAEKRLKNGDVCFIAEKEADIVHYEWICFNEHETGLQRKIRVGPNSAYLYDTYTVPKYRGKGINPAVYTNVVNYLSQRGIKEIYFIILSNNYISLRTSQKATPRKIGEVTLIKLLGKKIYKCKAETTRDYVKLKELLSL